MVSEDGVWKLLCDDIHAGACLGKNAQADDQFMVHLAIVLDWKTGGS